MELITPQFEFGVYVGGAAGTESGMTAGGPPDDAKKINDALNDLQGSASSFLVRCYAGYHGRDKEPRAIALDVEHFTTLSRKLDLVLCFQADEESMEGWKKFITDHIKRYGQQIRYLQITEEANVNLPSLDGYRIHSRKALVEGIIHAKSIAKDNGLNIQVGFNATPDFSPNKTFWKEIKDLARPDFYHSLDYVGLDFFPGVFRPLPSQNPADVHQLISKVIYAFKQDIGDAGIDKDIPLHITENGFPTHIEGSDQQQAEMLSMIITIVFELRSRFDIRTYELFSLRDADSNVQDIFYQFGIMHDDYSPKPAYFSLKELIKLFAL
jgi:hypothetical protein